MNKTMCWTAIGAFAAIILASATGPAAAMSQSQALSRVVIGDGAVLVAQGKKKKGKSSQSRISPEHQQQIRQHVPQEYHRYIPGMSSGGGAGGGAGGAGVGR